MNIIQIIEKRRSVRTFAPGPVSPDVIASLHSAINNTVSPLGQPDAAITIADANADSNFKPGTYGVIRNARTYLILSVAPGNDNELRGAFALEQVILQATALGLGTCWLGGTLRASSFRRPDIPDGYRIRIVSPVGFPEKPGIVERIMRRAAGSDNRKPFGSLFFDGSTGTPLDPRNTFAGSLSMVRLAPSASNAQPWRAMVKDGNVHFYARKGTFMYIDMGIALCHFYLAEQHYGHTGIFAADADAPRLQGLTYITSYHR